MGRDRPSARGEVPTSRIPPVPLALGLAGLIPFFGLALASGGFIALPGLDAGETRAGLAAYGAVILSFLGGVRWGVALRPTPGEAAAAGFALAVLPSLVGSAALALPRPWDAAALALAHAALGLADARDPALPAWYGRLRLILAAGAATGLAVGGAVA